MFYYYCAKVKEARNLQNKYLGSDTFFVVANPLSGRQDSCIQLEGGLGKKLIPSVVNS
jgi:hypothetical protein